MNPVPRSLLLPLDDTPESLKPFHFLARLYPDKGFVNLILHYLMPALAPVYQGKPSSEAMAAKKKERLQQRREKTRAVLENARKILEDLGFQPDSIQEDVQEKALSAAHHACRLADIRKVDAVVVARQSRTRLEGFLTGDAASALLHHCLVSPIWFVERDTYPRHAVVCLDGTAPSLRALDHAAFMLDGTQVTLEGLHLSPSVSSPMASGFARLDEKLEEWLKSPKGKSFEPWIREASEIVRFAGFDNERASFTIIPAKRKIPGVILDYCRSRNADIVVLGHGGAGGAWGFLKSSITKKIIGETHRMAVWVNQ